MSGDIKTNAAADLADWVQAKQSSEERGTDASELATLVPGEDRFHWRTLFYQMRTGDEMAAEMRVYPGNRLRAFNWLM